MNKKGKLDFTVVLTLVIAVSFVVVYVFSSNQATVQGTATSSLGIVISRPENKTYCTRCIFLSFPMNFMPSWIGYSLDGNANVTVEGLVIGTWTAELVDGSHSVVVYANDSVGNMCHSRTVYFTVDTRSPVITVFSPQNKTYATNAVLVNATSDEAVSWMGYSLDGQANVAVPENMTLSGLSDGTHSLVVYVKDAAGNVGTSETIFFSVAADNGSAFQLWILTAVVVILAVGAAVLIYVTRARKNRPSEKLMGTSETQ
ncbi:MAG TPA: hypothetical protein VMT01_04045 [Candidatus Acidoferrum sp.]|jgi:hypothetical protein|nr:hypothetical protein [Candidatus Acidoferrum sp.]